LKAPGVGGGGKYPDNDGVTHGRETHQLTLHTKTSPHPNKKKRMDPTALLSGGNKEWVGGGGGGGSARKQEGGGGWPYNPYQGDGVCQDQK